jgi:alkylation response protein AidB-like acyl-CoA dehydrogenase
MRVADRCVQVMGGSGLTDETIVEVRAFRIYDEPAEVHKWSISKNIKSGWKSRNAAVCAIVGRAVPIAHLAYRYGLCPERVNNAI